MTVCRTYLEELQVGAEQSNSRIELTTVVELAVVSVRESPSHLEVNGVGQQLFDIYLLG